jgi:hypothetical protein
VLRDRPLLARALPSLVGGGPVTLPELQGSEQLGIRHAVDDVKPGGHDVRHRLKLASSVHRIVEPHARAHHGPARRLDGALPHLHPLGYELDVREARR